MQTLTEDEFKAALPEKMKKSVNTQLISQINQTLSQPEEYEQFRENLISYAAVLKDGKFKMSQYIAAVKYTSYKLMGETNILAYSKTFPAKIQAFNAQGTASKDIASYVTAYNKSKLVNLIMEQALVPTWVLNQDMFQTALNVQYELATTAKSEKVRSDAANSLLTHLKQPENTKFELDVNIKADSSIAALQAETHRLVAQQQQNLRAGVTDMKEVAESAVVIDNDTGSQI